MIALAAVMAMSGAANAALIDVGQSVGNGYNGSVIFSMWDGSSAYELNLNTGVAGNSISGINTFVSDIAAAGNSMTFAVDSMLTTWLSTANTANLQWNVTAINQGNTIKQVLTSASVATLPVALSNQIAKGALNNAGGVYTQLNTYMSATVGEAVVPNTDTKGYAGIAVFGNNFGGAINFSNTAALGGSQLMAVMGTKTTGTALSTYAFDGITASVANNGSLTLASVAAVPEADSLAMLLAGLGAVATIVRRRRNGAAA